MHSIRINSLLTCVSGFPHSSRLQKYQACRQCKMIICWKHDTMLNQGIGLNWFGAGYQLLILGFRFSFLFLFQDSVEDMVGALESILEFKSESTMGVASRVAVKMVNILPSSLLQSHVLDLMRPLASLLSTWQFQVSISCASALNAILSNISIKTEREVWQILKETKVVGSLVDNIKEFSVGNKPTEYLEEMVSLLSKILWWWPQSRFCVWTDTELLNFLDTLQLERENSTKVAVLQLYSTLGIYTICHRLCAIYC